MPVFFASATMASCIAALSPPSSAKPDEMITAFLTPDGGALLERAEHRAGRNDDDGEVDRLPDLRDRRIAFQPVDIAVIGIDRIDLARKLILAQHRQQPARDLLQIARGADQGDAVRREERVERMRHSEGPFLLLLQHA